MAREQRSRIGLTGLLMIGAMGASLYPLCAQEGGDKTMPIVLAKIARGFERNLLKRKAEFPELKDFPKRNINTAEEIVWKLSEAPVRSTRYRGGPVFETPARIGMRIEHCPDPARLPARNSGPPGCKPGEPYLFFYVDTSNKALQKAIESADPGKAPSENPVPKLNSNLFQNVRLNMNEPNACSPEVTDLRWRGLRIQAPDRVVFQRGTTVGTDDAFAAIPICGFYHFNVSRSLAGQKMRLVAVDKSTGKAYSGDIVDRDPSPREPMPDSEPLTAEQMKGLSSGGYFNPNLADYVRLPQESAIYDVHVEYGEFKSNIVTIELVEEKRKTGQRRNEV